MKRFYLIGFALLLAFDTLNLVCFKLAGNHALPVEMSIEWIQRVFSHPWIYGAIFGYIGAFFTWMSLLKHAPIGPAFAASHLEVISVMLLSYWIFSEPVTTPQIIGAIAILLGIVCLAISETEVAESTPGAADSAHVVSP
ncbi:multidrug transporter EmrE-like cation transporter [Luteibacter rhizovicinus]|uniref:Multidrug transporter EmrE-like cation transporter n=1 Tax=Luteibacter rhizovicinus TaxID=242606 RepID=A0A4R3YV47_9GAMM|nr:EamA family transporter [Luteibacter rhizovicinus]TCV95678.1 multidrug transporter EmrE-like cation transporter [Luteibacter rhizovicinus]